MRKSFFRLLTVFLLVFATVIALGSCGGDKENNDGNEDTDVKTEANNVVTLAPDAALSYADYKIVRPDKSSTTIKEAAVALRDKAKELSGVSTIKLGTDFDGAVDKEILVGNTKRISDNTLLLKQFKIVREGNKIAILGGSDEAVLAGVNYFIENCMSKEGYLCGEGYVYYGGDSYTITSIEVNGKALVNAYIKSDIDNATYSQNIAAAIAEKAGLPSDVSKDEAKINMIFTDDIKTFGVGEGEWAVTVKDGVLYIVAADEYTQKAAYNYFMSLLNDSKGALKFTDGENKREKLETKEEFYAKEQLVIYKELPAEINRNYEYKVSVTQGDQTHSIPVYDHTMEYDPSNRGIGGDYHRRFSQFAFSGGQVRVDIKVGVDFSTYTVIPSAKNFESEFKDGVISVYLDEPDYFGIRLDDDDNTILSVFADLPEYALDIPAKGESNVIYVEDWYEPENGLVDITEPNTTLYIAPGAVVCGRVKVFEEAIYSKVTGRGVILDAFADIYSYDIRDGGTEGGGRKLCTLEGEGTIFDGPVLMDARCFNITTGSTGITVRNYKALSSMMTTDGITAGAKNALYEHCWIYCGDNGLVISWTQDNIFRDIVIGTTCAAVFPQGSTNNIEIENLYVFRANDGIVNHWYNSPYTKETTATVTMRNVDCIDATSFSRFFGGRNMGTLAKTFEFININLPTITGTASVHSSNTTSNIGRLIHMENPVEMFTENYTINFTNLYIDGQAITDESEVKIVNQWANEFTFTNDGKYTPVERDVNRVNYSAPGKVFVGELQVTFDDDVIAEGNDILVPADALIKAVRATNTATTVDKNGVKYIKSSDIKSLNTVDSAKVTNGSLYITLKDPKGNLLLPDEGLVSQIAESSCYQVDLVAEDNDGEYVYVCYDHGEYYTGGVSIMITDEIKMYGAGEYTVTFRARGAGAGSIQFGWTMDDADKYKSNYTTEEIRSGWSDHEFTFEVTEAMLANAELFTIRIKGTEASVIEYFSFRDVVLTKD